MKQIFLWQWIWIKIISCTNNVEDYSNVLKEWKDDLKHSAFKEFTYDGGALNEKKTELIFDLYEWFKVLDYPVIPNNGKDDIDTIQRDVDAGVAAGGRAEEILRTGGDRWSMGKSHRLRILY